MTYSYIKFASSDMTLLTLLATVELPPERDGLQGGPVPLLRLPPAGQGAAAGHAWSVRRLLPRGAPRAPGGARPGPEPPARQPRRGLSTMSWLNTEYLAS